MTREILLLVALTACAVDPSGLPGSGDTLLADLGMPPDGQIATDGSAVDAFERSCAPVGATLCREGVVHRCEMGGLAEVEACAPLGCAPDEAPRCARVIPSHVTDGSLLYAGTVDWTFSGEVVVDTDSGEVREDDVVIRPAGIGTLDGVPFATLDQAPPGADLGVFAIRSLTLDASATLRAEGRRALVLLVRGDATIAGTVDVGGNGRTAGPGGGRGGGRREDGGGPGGGQKGDLHGLFGGQQGGGGGGGHVLAGGPGGTDDGGRGGDGGPVISNPEGSPLVGGGGGGGGADVDDGGPGGGGGGAVQISAGGMITVTPEGVVRAPGAGGSRSSEGAGGGGAGGTVYLEAPTVIVQGILAVNGGGGGGAGDGSTDGARGGDDPERAVGGDGDGGDGGRGGAAGELDGLPGEDADPGGGGGGAAGRVVIRTAPGGAVVEGTLSVMNAARTLGELRTE